MSYEFYCYVDQKRTRLDVMPRYFSHEIKSRIEVDACYDKDGKIMYKVTIDGSLENNTMWVEYFEEDADAYDYAIEKMTSELGDIIYSKNKQKGMIASLIDYANDCGHDVRFNEY